MNQLLVGIAVVSLILTCTIGGEGHAQENVRPLSGETPESEVSNAQARLESKAGAIDAEAKAGAAKLSTTPEFDVTDYGAVGDGTTDNTAAFQAALNAARNAGGGTVFVPRGNYLIAGSITIGSYVTLEGIFTAPAAWAQNKGTTLLTTTGRGDANATSFIRLQGTNATVKGVTIYYPEQVQTNQEVPVAYPWCVESIAGDNHTLLDLLLVNPYQGIKLQQAGRHFVSRVYGQPLKTGIYIDRILDVGRVENVHFWPFGYPFDPNSALYKWQVANGDAFVIGRSDWQYMFNTFCFGYAVGYKFIETENGVCNGNFLGIGADYCQIAVDVQDCWDIGLLITNGEFVGIVDPLAVGLRVQNGCDGTIQLTNCSFWGPQRYCADLAGSGSVTFIGCNFLGWDKQNQGNAAILQKDGGLTVTACYFNADKNDVAVGPQAEEAILYGNRAVGGFQVDNRLGNMCQQGLNTRVPGSAVPTQMVR